MHQQKNTPNQITMPAWRQVICSNPPWNYFCPPSPKSSLLLFPCSKSVFLVCNKGCSNLALFLPSSDVLIFYSSAADSPLLLATIFWTAFHHSRKLSKRCLKYLTLGWFSQVFSQTKARSQLHAAQQQEDVHTLHSHKLSNKPKWQIKPINPSPFQRGMR